MRGQTAMNDNEFNPFWVIHALGASMTLGALAGLAAFLKSKKEITTRGWVAATIYSGLFSLATAALAFGALPVEKWDLNAVCIVLGLSVMSGLGGNTFLGIAIEVARAVAALKGK